MARPRIPPYVRARAETLKLLGVEVPSNRKVQKLCEGRRGAVETEGRLMVERFYWPAIVAHIGAASALLFELQEVAPGVPGDVLKALSEGFDGLPKLAEPYYIDALGVAEGKDSGEN